MHQFFLDQLIFLWSWVFVALSKDAMSNVHFFVPCHSTFEIVAGWLLLLLSVTMIVKGRSMYTFCNRQSLLKPADNQPTQLNCYPVFHNTCNRSCATWLIAHLMLASAACSGHSSIAFGEEISHANILSSVYGMNSSECTAFAYNRPSEILMLFTLHIPLEFWFLCLALASSFALFLSF